MKKFTKKLTALFLAFALIISIMPLNVSMSFAETLNPSEVKTYTVTHKNPAYEGLDIKTYSPKHHKVYSANQTFDTVEEAGDYLKKQMIDRNGTITLTINQAYYEGIFEDIFYEAVKDNGYGNSSAGDYLYWNWAGYEGSGQATDISTTLIYDMSYLSTYAQELQVNAEVKKVLDSLDVYNEEEYDKVLAVHDYIVENIEYDYDLNNYSGYNAIVDKNVVCQGFASITSKMLKELNVGVRVISGTGNGGAHGWNIIKLGSYWYNTDNTWDENLASYDMYSYFLKGSTDFPDHIRDDQFDTESFHLTYPMAKSAYDKIDVKFENGTDVITKKIANGDILEYIPEAPTKDGYTFVGWFKDVDDITTEYQSGATYTEDVTYTAKWAHVDMLGAQVKAIVNDESGIRFGTKIYDDGDEIVEKGTLILPAALLPQGEALTLDTPKVVKSVGKVN